MAKLYKMDAKWRWVKIHVWNVRAQIDVWHVWKKRVRCYSVHCPSKFNCRANVVPNVAKSVQSNHFRADVFWAKVSMTTANGTAQINARHVPASMVRRFVDAKLAPFLNVHQHIRNCHRANVVHIAEIYRWPKPNPPARTREKPFK